MNVVFKHRSHPIVLMGRLHGLHRFMEQRICTPSRNTVRISPRGRIPPAKLKPGVLNCGINKKKRHL